MQNLHFFCIFLGEIFRNVHFFFQNFCPEEKIFRKCEKNARFSDFLEGPSRNPLLEPPPAGGRSGSPETRFFRGFDPLLGTPAGGPARTPETRVFSRNPDFFRISARSAGSAVPTPNPPDLLSGAPGDLSGAPAPPSSPPSSVGTADPSRGPATREPWLRSAQLTSQVRRRHRRTHHPRRVRAWVASPIPRSRQLCWRDDGVSIGDDLDDLIRRAWSVTSSPKLPTHRSTDRTSASVGDYLDDLIRRAGSVLPIPPRQSRAWQWFLRQLR